jgi:PRC-barrel domain
MTLFKIKDFEPDYQNHADNQDIKSLDLYLGNDKIGSIDDVLVDEEGQFRYLVIKVGFWSLVGLGKRVLLPIGCARINYGDRRVYAKHLTQEQVEALPELTEEMKVDYDYEEQVRKIYRSASMANAPASYGVGYAGAQSAPPTVNTAPILDLDVGYAGYDRSSYTYGQDPELYDIDEQDHEGLKLYQQRLVAQKMRQKAEH